MSSILKAEKINRALLSFAPMQLEDIDHIMVIEKSAYPHPWTRGNFLDSLYSGYQTLVLRDASYSVLAYFLVMLAVDEAHLLNITVRRDLHGQGFGRLLLDKVAELARAKKMASVLLEVRPSNTRALAIYERYGFVRIGQRKGYYPAADNTREDAIVMRLPI
jgi:ribosomal-protein-alanine N-acetyltransferase